MSPAKATEQAFDRWWARLTPTQQANLDLNSCRCGFYGGAVHGIELTQRILEGERIDEHNERTH